jgi:nifR3 family TIM-barrel protein
MISAKALLHRDGKTARMMAIDPRQEPCIIQIFGSEPEVLAEGAKIALELEPKSPAIDINMGCPVPKVAGYGEGSALMGDLPRASAIIEAVKKAVPKVPVTVKFRSGLDAEHINAVEFARMAEQSGADAVCVHGRTREQYYTGKSDRSIIRAVKQAVSVPVIASGDAMTAADCRDIMRETGADFLMVARGAQGDPWIFSELAGRTVDRSTEEVVRVMKYQAALSCAHKGEERAMREVRKHLLWYMDRLVGAKPFKVKLSYVSTLAELDGICEEILQADLQRKEW